MTRSRVAAVVPAAGASSRFGSTKLLADVGGVALVGRTIDSLLGAHVDRVVLVVAPDHQLAAVAQAIHPRVAFIVNHDPSRGMFSSIQTGLAAVEADVLLVLPADMPFVPSDVIERVATRSLATGAVVVPAHGGRRGHPVAIPGRWRSAVLAERATSNLKAALSRTTGAPPIEVDVDDPGVLRDIDVPGDLEPLARADGAQRGVPQK